MRAWIVAVDKTDEAFENIQINDQNYFIEPWYIGVAGVGKDFMTTEGLS